jgi:hypothetical protein
LSSSLFSTSSPPPSHLPATCPARSNSKHRSPTSSMLSAIRRCSNLHLAVRCRSSVVAASMRLSSYNVSSLKHNIDTARPTMLGAEHRGCSSTVNNGSLLSTASSSVGHVPVVSMRSCVARPIRFNVAACSTAIASGWHYSIQVCVVYSCRFRNQLLL